MIVRYASTEMIMDPANLPPPTEDDQQAIGRFLDALWLERGLAKQTLASYRTDLSLLAGWLAARGGLYAVSRGDLLEHLAWRMRAGYSARSTARLLSCLRGFYRHAQRGADRRGPHAGYRHAATGAAAARYPERGGCGRPAGGAGCGGHPGAARPVHARGALCLRPARQRAGGSAGRPAQPPPGRAAGDRQGQQGATGAAGRGGAGLDRPLLC